MAQHDMSHDARMRAAGNGQALVDGTYVTRDRSELEKAFEHYRDETGNTTELRSYLIRRAVELHSTDLIPDDWEIDE